MASLLDLQQLDVEDKGAVGGNTRNGLAAVCQVCWDSESTLTTNRHTSNTDVPSLDDLAGSELEGEWLALLVRYETISV